MEYKAIFYDLLTNVLREDLSKSSRNESSGEEY